MVKFGKQIVLNSVPEWRDDYVSYGQLKSKIFACVDAVKKYNTAPSGGQPQRDGLSTRLIVADVHDDLELSALISFLEKQLEKVNGFYLRTLAACETTLLELEDLIVQAGLPTPSTRARTLSGQIRERLSSAVSGHSSKVRSRDHIERSESESDHDDTPMARARTNTHTSEDPRGLDRLFDTIGPRLVLLYGTLQDLKQFRLINREAFRKGIKKFSKALGPPNHLPTDDARELAVQISAFLEARVDISEFWVNEEPIDQLKSRTESLYIDHVWTGDRTHAVGFLEQNTRDLIIFRRNVIWKDLLIDESRRSTLSTQNDPTWIFKPVWILVALLALVALVVFPVTPIGNHQAQRCLAMLVAAIILWVSEAIPLYVTSLLIPLLSVALGVSDESPPKAAKAIVSAMMTQTLLLIIGGFSIASALSKYQLDSAIATFVLSRSGTKPKRVAFAVMLVGAFLSMFLSNVASPMLCISVLSPVIRALPKISQFRKGLLLAIAFSCNIGGMLTPIASPQNVVALQALTDAFATANVKHSPISFGVWMLVAIPVGLVLLVITHIFLFTVCYRPDIDETPLVAAPAVHWDKPRVFTVVVTLSTIVLWCMGPVLEDHIGQAGMVALIPVVLFYGSGILRKDNFDNLPWNVIFLVAGGSALSTSVNESELLHKITDLLTQGTKGQPLFVVVLAFVALIAVITSLISHTVGAMIIMPVAAGIWCSTDSCDILNTEIMVACCALMCSGAMMLPISSFPNVTATSCSDELGRPYLTAMDILKTGAPATLFCVLIIISVGFGLSSVVFDL
eukprot:c12766_g1_i1.p1 GENE.c12766_g1_i1~~c12766_g1_i1.p1  ORF type:complete len:802 (+),score=175.53 c12766_g1_i1:23-2407(+)